MANSAFFSICYYPIAEYLNDIAAALVLQHLDYWLKNPNCGYLLNDGCKWIYNGYIKLAEQLPVLSQHQIGRLIRKMEDLEWIISERFHNLNKNIGFVGNPPQGWQEYNQKKWYKLNYQKIFEDTGFDLLNEGAGGGTSSESPQKSNKKLKPLQQANVQNCTNQFTDPHDASSKSAQSSIYIKEPYLSQNREAQKERELENQQQEVENTNKQLGSMNPDPLSTEQIKEKSSFDNKGFREDKNSGASSKIRENRTKPNKDDNRQISETASQEIWEIAPGHPYPVFLNWRAQMHYKPQGGKWETNARGNAHSEFYNNRQKTTSVLFPEFLQYLDNVVNNCDQQLANDIKAILPSLFISLPEATHENVKQLMANFEQLVERGVEVALPNLAATASNQSMPYAAATATSKIKPLESLAALPPTEESPLEQSILDLVVQKQVVWRNIPKLRVKIREWADSNSDVMIIDEYGPVLACSLPESSNCDRSFIGE
ncbi:hypothetical protein H6G27_29645 [Nostoc linckia FACHB-104]|nr:hypothetical protein [Nostoc linckia FACHB-104]